MSTISAVLEADPDGTLHVPLPAELRGVKVRITAELEPVSATDAEEQQTRRAKALQALDWLQKRGTFNDVNAVEWQREIRKDRELPGREE